MASNNIIGREHEQKQLLDILSSRTAEFVAVYGRRRIGKTFLIREFFKSKNCIFFQFAGLKNTPLQDQLDEFTREIERAFYQSSKATKLQSPKSWMGAFNLLTDTIEKPGGRKKIVLFLDEVPWIASKGSKFLHALDYYWNRFWVNNQQLKLVICGSASSWIIDKVLNNKGGLHNRVTLRIPLSPFTLKETRLYLYKKGIKLDFHQILQLYLCIGGVPFYLKFIKKGLSAIQNINLLCFKKEGGLFNEFSNLFASLFNHAEIYEEIIKLIASKREGIDRAELERAAKLSKKGGTFTQRLKELEETGFIQQFTSFGRKRGTYYKIIDEYTLFYLTWVAPAAKSRLTQSFSARHWEAIAQTPAWKAWAGLAFEAICYKHIENIRKTLHIPEGATASTWKYLPRKGSTESGAQIDLLFDRDDGVINICEIKFCEKPFVLDKEYAKILLKKVDIYHKITKTEKQIFISLITSSKLKKSIYSEEVINSEVALHNLFLD